MLLSNGRVAHIAPQTLGETTPLTSTGWFYPNAGIQLEKQFATYAQMYRSQMWISTVVDKVSDSIARLSMNVWDMGDPNGNTIDNTSPFARLMAQPNSEMSTFSFWRWTAATYEIYGEAFLLKLRDDNGRIRELVPFHPARVSIERNAETGELTYIFTTGLGGSTGIFTAPQADVIPFIRYNPDSLMRGLSRMESLRMTLASEDSARRASAAWWKNMGRPSMVLSTDKALSKDATTRLKEQFDRSHGGSDNAGGTVVLQDGLKALPIQLNAEEMQYIQTRILNREEVCARYDIPPPVVHILDHATYSNITEQMRSMYRDTMAPRIEEFESVLDAYLSPEFQGPKYARFAVADILRGDIDQRATTAGALVERGIAKPSEVRPWFDLNDAGPVADKLYANATMQELGRPAERITITDALPAAGQQLADGEDVLREINQGPGPKPTEAPAPGSAPSVPAPAKPLPQKRNYTRDLAGRMGRGKSLVEATADLLAKHPEDRTEILSAAAEVVTEKASE